MIQPQIQARPEPRRGVILMVVLILLTLFAIVGLSFALYTSSEAQSSQLAREAVVQPRPDAEPELLASFFLGQLIYDTDDVRGVYSALRGHSLARSMYGAYYARQGDPDIPNTVPFNGTGRLHTRQATTPDDQLAFMNPFKVDDYQLINYTFYPGDLYPSPNGPSLVPLPFLRDPERTNPNLTRAQPGAPPPWRTDPSQPPGQYVGGFNAPYTYPDLNNMFLAAVQANGTVLVPSYHRPWLFGSMTQVDTNPNWWHNSVGKYLTLRPRPVDQLTRAQAASAGLPWPLRPETLNPGQQQALKNLLTALQARGQLFPYPEDEGGDVKNLVGAPGGNDSIWIDLDFPVLTAPNGQKFKPLFAPLIVDLDNRINVNVHGNVRGATSVTPSLAPPLPRSFVANQCWGPWTVDVSKVLDYPANSKISAEEWKQLFYGLTWHANGQPDRSKQTAPGRYGLNLQPITRDPNGNPVQSALPWTSIPHNYAPVDYDECDPAGKPTPALNLQNGPNCFPKFPTGYDLVNSKVDELQHHPALYNVSQPAAPYQRRFPASDLEALLRFGDTNSPFLTSELFQLCPQNFGEVADPVASAAAARRRRLVTVRSFDVESPGVTPWLTQFHSGAYTWNGSSSMPYGGPAPFTLPAQLSQDQTLSQRLQDPNDFRIARVGNTNTFATDWRSAVAALGRLDLNRPLPPYPAPANGVISDDAQFSAAEVARQQLAEDIYLRLISVTGAYNPFLDAGKHQPAPTDVNALRDLAQLAVNIVDFIDDDSYSTPFNWGAIGQRKSSSDPRPGFADLYSNEWVFGVELPRVVINEAYAQYFIKDEAKRSNANVQMWVELYNPLTTDSNQPGWDQGDVDLSRGYRLLLAKPSTTQATATNLYPSDDYLLRPDNPRGTPRKVNAGDQDHIYNQAEPPTQQQGPCIVDFAKGGPSLASPIVRTSNGGTGLPSSGARGYLVIGPDVAENAGPTLPQGHPQVYKRPEMKYEVASSELVSISGKYHPRAPIVVLQRLACPYRPHNPLPNDPEVFPRGDRNDPTKPVNPYITIDYFSDVNRPPTSGGLQITIADQNRQTDAAKPPSAPQSDGRREPYAGHPSQKVVQQVNGGGAKNTFFSINNPVNPNFQWLVHLDRQLSSPMELMHVAAVKPAALTQEFIHPPPGGHMTPFNHLVPWYDQDRPQGSTDSHRLYRLFEFLATRSRAAGLQAPAITGQFVNNTQIKADRLSWITPSGVPAAIKAGDVIVIDKGLPSHENARVQGIIAASPTDTRILVTRLFKTHSNPITIELTTMGDRVPGKININTVWDPETFLALGAGTPSHNYDNDPSQPNNDTKLIYQQLIALRSPGLAQGQLTQNDRPFLGMAANHYGTDPMNYSTPTLSAYGNSGVNHTLFGAAQATGDQRSKRLLQVPFNTDPANPRHPYVANQLLNKLFNNVTTRSNVFAVWVTVGFFEVLDDTVRPVKLGAEIGKAENRQIRHRFFSIVDRTALTVPSLIGTLRGTILNPGLQAVQMDQVTNQVPIGPAPPIGPINTTIGRAAPQTIRWTLQPGDVIVVGEGTPNQETVTVAAVDVQKNILRAEFSRAHLPTETVTLHVVPGNPGPVARFNPRERIYEEVVPYLSVIE